MLWAGVRMTLISCALASLIALSSDPLSDSADSISCLVSPPAPLRTIDRFRAALTGERTTLTLGRIFCTAFSTRKPKAWQRHRTESRRPTQRAVHVCRAWCRLSSGGRPSRARTGTRQLIDQTDSGGAPPTGHQVVARDRVED